ncbi:MAG: hypothetical protein H7A08_04660 [Oceanospirillaceae bacterium]|nr:hypothetical protein [Oceanospirillaceae bacterium]
MRTSYTVIFSLLITGFVSQSFADEHAPIKSNGELNTPVPDASNPAQQKVWSSIDNHDVVPESASVQPAEKLAHAQAAATPTAEMSTTSHGTESVTGSSQVNNQANNPVSHQTNSPAQAALNQQEPVKPAVAEQPPTESMKTPQNLQAELPHVNALSEVQAVGAHIYDVKGIGSWQRQGMSGQVRMVITRSSRRDDVYLQWVAWRDGSPRAIIASDAVVAINEDANYQVRAISSQIMQGKPVITLSLEDKYSKEMLRGVIRVLDVGVYECQVLR